MEKSRLDGEETHLSCEHIAPKPAHNHTGLENEATNVNEVPSKGMKRSNSGSQVPLKKRTAFGDITNAIHSHANRIAQGRSKKQDGIENCVSQKPPAAKAKAKRISTNKLKASKSMSVLPQFEICADDSDSDDVIMATESEVESFTKEEAVTSSISEAVEMSLIPDGVDPFDTDPDPDHVSEYAHSIFKNMRRREQCFQLSNYFSEEGRLSTGVMRAILVDWLVEVQENFQLYHETLYVAVKLLDCYLEKNDTPKERLQLVGATALLIACKVEEQHPPPLDDFQYICDDAYTSRMFLDTEMKIFKALNYDINIPIPYRYLRRFSRVNKMPMEILTLSRFILELSLQDSQYVHIPASKIAAACLCLAMKMKNVGVWNVNHIFHCGYEENELVELMKQLNQTVIDSAESKLKNIRTKYSHPVHYTVATIAPLSVDVFARTSTL